MGGKISTHTECKYHGVQQAHSSRDYRYLLGDLNKLTPAAQQIFNLGKGCLNSVQFSCQQKHFEKLDQHFRDAPDSQFVPHNDRSHQTQSVEDPSEKDPYPKEEQDGFSVSGEESYGSRLFQAIRQTAPLHFSQTYIKWRTVYDFQKLVSVCAPKRTIIYIQPLDDFPDFISNFEFHFRQLTTDLFGLLQGFAQIFFMGLDVCINPVCTIQQLGWSSLITSRVHTMTGQKQYKASDFHPLLQRLLPSDGVCIVGITWTDLFPDDDLNFVFGETSFEHKTGIFCFGRFEPKAFDKDGQSDVSEVDGLLVWKLMKVISHELCHGFGLQHCTFFECLMNESTSMTEALKQPLFLCPVCLRKLQKVCGFDVLERYSNLLVFLQELHKQLPSEYSSSAIYWLQQCISFIESGTSNAP